MDAVGSLDEYEFRLLDRIVELARPGHLSPRHKTTAPKADLSCQISERSHHGLSGPTLLPATSREAAHVEAPARPAVIAEIVKTSSAPNSTA